MKKLLLLFAIVLFSLSSCHNDDDKKTDDPLLHMWTLVSVKGGFAGTDVTFDERVILWKFKANGTIEITNSNQDKTKEDYFETGSYDYKVKNNTAQILDCPKSMDVDNINFSCYKIDESGRLILDSAPADGHTLTFYRTDLPL